MKHLFGPHGRGRLETLVASRPLLAFDFDGTLCPLEAEPDASRTAKINLPLMKRLVRRVPVAIISGRSVPDLKKRLGFTPTYLVGNHGLEGLDARAAARSVAAVRGWREELGAAWGPFEDDPGVFIENKVFSLSLHFRLSRRPAAASRFLRERIAGLRPKPRVIGGKFIYNLTLPRSAHKGTALAEIMRRERSKNALFIGDDVTDEDAFAIRRPGLINVRVGSSRVSKAGLYVRDLEGVTRLLEFLNERL